MIQVLKNGQPHEPSHAATRLYLGIINDFSYSPWLKTRDGVDEVLRDVLRVINRHGSIFEERMSLDDLSDECVRWIEARLYARTED